MKLPKQSPPAHLLSGWHYSYRRDADGRRRLVEIHESELNRQRESQGLQPLPPSLARSGGGCGS